MHAGKIVYTTASIFFLAARFLIAGTNAHSIDVSSHFGGSGDNEAVYGSAIISDGTIVMAGCIGDKTVDGVTATLLNGATATSSGAVVHLSADATTVLSITRIADKVVDMSIDSEDNIYCAAMEEGVIILDAQAEHVHFEETFDKPVHRVDAGPSGYFAVLTCDNTDNLSQKLSAATIHVFSPQHQELGSFGGNSHYTRDVCVHEASQTVVSLGFKNIHANDGQNSYPVDVPAFQGRSYDGTVKYEGYNYSASELNANGSNMADARGQRVTVGQNGNLYMAFEVDGGNYVFDNDPHDVMINVTVAAGDLYNQNSNTGTEPSVFYGQYEPSTGDYIKGQYFTTRLDNGRGNTVFIRNGAIEVDSEGNIYLCGASASGLPLTFDPTGGYTGGAYLLIIKADLSQRLYCGRIGRGITHSIALSENSSGSQKIFSCGAVMETHGYSLYTREPLQKALSGKQDGFFSLIEDSDGDPSNTPPVAEFTTSQVSGTQLEFDASLSSDADGDVLEYAWSFNDGDSWAFNEISSYTYPSPIDKNHRISLTVIDENGGWDQKLLLFGPPKAYYTFTPRAGQAPIRISFDGSSTIDPNDSIEELKYRWYFDRENQSSLKMPSFTFEKPGVYKPILHVQDNMAGGDRHEEFIMISEDESKAKRFDFGKTDRNIVDGFSAVGAEEYTSAKGYGFKKINDDVGTGDWNFQWNNELTGDAVGFSKYADGSRFDGEFMVDVPDGMYTVLMHFMQKYSRSFNGVEVEGKEKITSVSVEGSSTGKGKSQADVFTVSVSDEQMNFIFRRGSGSYPTWFVSGIQIIPGSYDYENIQLHAGNTLTGNTKPVSYTTHYRVYDICGRCVAQFILPTSSPSTRISQSIRKSLGGGMYIVTPISMNGHRYPTQKLLIK